MRTERGELVFRRTIPLEPEQAGSKNAFLNQRIPPGPGTLRCRNCNASIGRVVVTDANKGLKGWRRDVAQILGGEKERDRLFDGALEVEFQFYVPRPPSVSVKGRPLPTVQPDLLKYGRALEDALTGVVWTDDARIVDEHMAKRYGSPARCEIRVWKIEVVGEPSDDDSQGVLL